jgi:hypothetical protein
MQGRKRTAFAFDNGTVDSNQTRGAITQDGHSFSVACSENFIRVDSVLARHTPSEKRRVPGRGLSNSVLELQLARIEPFARQPREAALSRQFLRPLCHHPGCQLIHHNRHHHAIASCG